MQINPFSTFTVSHRLWGCRSLHSLLCFPKVSFSFTISSVNYPEKIRHTCQNNILLIKQEDVFSLLSSWIDVIFNERCLGMVFITKALAGQAGAWTVEVLSPALTGRNWHWDTHSEEWNLSSGLTFVMSVKYPLKQREDYSVQGTPRKWVHLLVAEGTGGSSTSVSQLWGGLRPKGGSWG